MSIKELYKELIEAYSNENLNKITAKLILLYKNKNYDKIREIANRISKYILINEEKDAKCFSKLIMLYHPDKGEEFRKDIQSQYARNDFETLTKYSHILMLSDIEKISVTTSKEDIEFETEYEWDIEESDGYSFSDSEFIDDSQEESEDEIYSVDYEKSFYNEIKIREYGNINIEFPSYYLEDFEEFELAYSGLESLDGVEHCVHAKILDVSNNKLTDISKLWDLKNLEELYLVNNQIGYIDALSSLLKLRILDLSGNQIDDISPLMNLDKLEYVNLIGNRVPEIQINKLKAKGVLVMMDKVITSDDTEDLFL